jgi:hypothetical protein
MSAYLWLIWKNQWRQDFPSRYAWIGLCIGITLELLIYYFTSRAFGENLKGTFGIEGTYFQYVILGELVLWLPMACVAAFAGGLRDSHYIGVFERFLLLPWHPARLLLVFGVNTLLLGLLQHTLLLLIALCFGFRVSLERIPALLAFQALALPCFLAMGLCTAAIFLRYQRGLSVIGFATKASAILAGVYFPTTVFPSWIGENTLISPFNALLEGSRALQENKDFPWGAVYSLMLWSIFLWIIAIPLSKSAVKALKKRGSVEIIQPF